MKITWRPNRFSSWSEDWIPAPAYTRSKSVVIFNMLFCCALLLAAADVHGKTTATFVDEAVVMNQTVTLANIAQIQPDDERTRGLRELVIASAPAPGQSKQLQAASIIAALRNHPEVKGVHWLGSPVISVLRKSIVIEQNRLQQIIADFLAAQADELPAGEIRFTAYNSPSQLVLPYGEVTWKVTPSRPDILQSSIFSIYFHVDGEPVQNCTVRGKMELFTDVVTTTGTIRRGDRIQADQVELAEKNILLLDHPHTRVQDVIGMVANRTLPAGRPLRDGDCTAPPVVSEGQYVKIIAQKGHLHISANGIAKSSGGSGEVIRVKNINSNKLIYAKVKEPGIVSVEF